MNKLKTMFFDAEWVTAYRNVSEMKDENPSLYSSFLNRVERWNSKRVEEGKTEMSEDEHYEKTAGMNPEFIKIIVISFGVWSEEQGKWIIKTIKGHDEKALLEEFNNDLNRARNKYYILGGHSIKRFDMPYISKRCMINGIKPSLMINHYGKKPWDIDCYDISEVWGQGCNQESYTPLDLIASCLGIPTPKDDISGADVKNVYYNELDEGLNRIAKYCEKDVEATIRIAESLNALSY